jgi:hypothetical protein
VVAQAGLQHRQQWQRLQIKGFLVGKHHLEPQSLPLVEQKGIINLRLLDFSLGKVLWNGVKRLLKMEVVLRPLVERATNHN